MGSKGLKCGKWEIRKNPAGSFLISRFPHWIGDCSQTHFVAEILRLTAAEFDFRAAFQMHEQPAAEPRLDLVDPGKVDDLPAVRAEEVFRIEPLLHRVERAEKLRLRAF